MTFGTLWINSQCEASHEMGRRITAAEVLVVLPCCGKALDLLVSPVVMKVGHDCSGGRLLTLASGICVGLRCHLSREVIRPIQHRQTQTMWRDYISALAPSQSRVM